MADTIFLNAVRHAIDPRGHKGSNHSFDIGVYKTNGAVVRGRCFCTSSYFANDTVNLKFIDSGEIRKFHACLIFEYNGLKVLP